jgi:peptidoglycan/xylan/chitin deacetylase (PgdA/CDA1 family)
VKTSIKTTLTIALIALLILSTLLAVALPAHADTADNCGVDLPIVMYHSTHNKNLGKYTVSPAEFEYDMKYLINKGRHFVTVKDLVAFQEMGVPLPENPIMVTLDDGFLNNYLWVFPIIKKLKVKCIISVIGNLTDANYKEHYSASLTHSHLTYEQMKEMADTGLVEIQNHTYGMHGLKSTNGRNGLTRKPSETHEQYVEVLTKDLMTLNEKVKQHTGITLTAVAYPYGEYSDEAIEVVKALGFKAGFTCFEHINHITASSSLFKLGRFNRPHGISQYQFFLKLGVK